MISQYTGLYFFFSFFFSFLFLSIFFVAFSLSYVCVCVGGEGLGGGNFVLNYLKVLCML